MISTHVIRRKDIALEFGVDVRTVDRWKAEGVLPKAKRLGGRPYWTADQITQAERIQIKRWTERERQKVKRASKLFKARIRSRVQKHHLEPMQLGLPLFL